ncbi:MAG: hypothetical protein R2715_19950 [Ilumatobacteraceae bacterium]
MSEFEVTVIVRVTFEFNAAVGALQDYIEAGELGDLLHFNAARLNLGLYQTDINVVWDLAPHDISIMNFLLRSLWSDDSDDVPTRA